MLQLATALSRMGFSTTYELAQESSQDLLQHIPSVDSAIVVIPYRVVATAECYDQLFQRWALVYLNLLDVPLPSDVACNPIDLFPG